MKAANVVRFLGWLAMVAGVVAAVEAVAPKASVADLAWLAGNWRLERNGRVTVERWSVPAGGLLLGTSHTYAGERTVEYEFMAIRANAAGELEFRAKPSGQPEATFRLTQRGARSVRFENPQHDFPQVISYGLNADGSLLAAIEGTKNGQNRRVEFPYQPSP